MNFFVLGSIPGLFTFFTELIFHVNIVSFLQKFEIYRIDELFPAIIFPLIGFFIDHRIKLIKKKEFRKTYGLQGNSLNWKTFTRIQSDPFPFQM